MKKRFAALLLFVLAFTVCGCSGSKPSEKKIKKDIQENHSIFVIDDKEYEMKIADLTVEKVQSDKKRMTCECQVNFENEYFSINRRFDLSYAKYKREGWVLEECDSIDNKTWDISVKEMPSEYGKLVYDNLYAMLEMEETDYNGETVYAGFRSIILKIADINYEEKGVALYEYDADCDGDFLTLKGKISMYCRLVPDEEDSYRYSLNYELKDNIIGSAKVSVKKDALAGEWATDSSLLIGTSNNFVVNEVQISEEGEIISLNIPQVKSVYQDQVEVYMDDPNCLVYLRLRDDGLTYSNESEWDNYEGEKRTVSKIILKPSVMTRLGGEGIYYNVCRKVNGNSSASNIGNNTEATTETTTATTAATTATTAAATTATTTATTAATTATTATTAADNTNTYHYSQYILPDSNSRYLTADDLKNLSKNQLRLARNEIYARHGRKFKDKELQKYFDECEWYRGTVEPEDFSDDVLNNYEKDNLDLISKYEKK